LSLAASSFDPFAGTPVDWDDIAGRAPFEVDWAAVRRRIGGQRVLITGAGGSLGRPLADSLARVAPSRLVLYDHHESSLFRLRQALTAAHPHLSLGAVLGDVRGARRLTHVFEQERPSLVFHLAAYKHVPWGEDDPEAFVETNVLGARNVLRAAAQAGVDQIVYPSTDKAIDPPSLYGATKRLVEMLLQSRSRAGGPRATIVRFVNVLGSQGSAPETFARQIKEGRPLTITDRAMRRYWITPGHANLLLLHAACLDERAAIVAPDAGDEIAAEEIARRVFRALRPDAPGPEIAVTGLRPGERLSEPLSAADERLDRCSLPGLQVVRGTPIPERDDVDVQVARIAEMLDAGAAPDAVRAAVFAAVRTLESGRR
jgi:FlaA1/EpsC-like NDP-sugar epimerase